MKPIEPSASDWAPGPRSPSLTRDAVDVWRADLADTDGASRDLLSDEERARMGRFAGTEHGRRWQAARGILRALLAAYLDADPRALRFELGPHGKPALAQQSGDSPTALRFNLSHAGGTALYAVAAGREVGVDLEREGRRFNAVAVARRIFGAEEAERLAALDPASRDREFLRRWVRHEAVVKCAGTGIGAAMEETDRPQPEPWVAEVDVGPGAFAAVAGTGNRCELRCWQWPARAAT